MAKFADLVKGLMLDGQAGLAAARAAFKVEDVDTDWSFVPKDTDEVAKGVAGLAGLVLEKALNAREHAKKYLGVEGYSPQQIVSLLHAAVGRFLMAAHELALPQYRCQNPDCVECKKMTGPEWKLKRDVAFVELLISVAAYARKQGIGEGIEGELKRIQKDAFMTTGSAPKEVQ